MNVYMHLEAALTMRTPHSHFFRVIYSPQVTKNVFVVWTVWLFQQKNIETKSSSWLMTVFVFTVLHDECQPQDGTG